MSDLGVTILTIGIPTVIASFAALAYLYWSVKRTERRFGGDGTVMNAVGREHAPGHVQKHDPTSGLAREGIALNRAFASITDPKLRADVVAHVEAVARYAAERGGRGQSDD